MAASSTPSARPRLAVLCFLPQMDEGDDAAADAPATAVAAGGDGAAVGASAAGGGEEKEGSAMIERQVSDNIMATRTYDITLTYDNYYRVPHVFLFGYDESSQPLSAKEMFEDIMQDYANRTVTMDPHPHMKGGVIHAAIHPCKHSAVMKNIVGHLTAGGSEARIDRRPSPAAAA